MNTAEKAEQLKQVTQKMEQDVEKLPLVKEAKEVVPSEGNPDAQIMFIGEAAGYHEYVQRRPFVGLAGKLLTKTLEEVGLRRQEVFIANMLRCRPPNNRDPLPEEIAAYAPYLDAEIDIIEPKIIATLGRFSMGKFLPLVKISQVHGQPRWVDWPASPNRGEKGKKILIMPLYHPAAALRSTQLLNTFKADFAKLPQLLNTLNGTPAHESKPTTESKPEEPQNQQLSLI